jgi:nucleoid-associated protein YgaU
VSQLKSAGITEADIDAWKNFYQYEINWYINKANQLDEAAAAELRQLMPKPSPDPKPKPKPKPTNIIGGKTVTVVPWGSDPQNPAAGSLWGIAQQEYGNGNYWPLIYEANKDKYGGNWGPNDIQPGWQIDVPPIKRGAPIPEPPANSNSPA